MRLAVLVEVPVGIMRSFPTSPRIMPAAAEPKKPASWQDDVIRETALTRSSWPTRSGIDAWRDGLSKASVIP